MTKTFHPNNNNNPDTRDPRKYVTRKKDPGKRPLGKLSPRKIAPTLDLKNFVNRENSPSFLVYE